MDDYYAAVNWNRMDDEKRAARQWAKFDIGDSETVTGKDGDILDPPSKMGVSVPPAPSELVNRPPRFWTFDCGLRAKGESDPLPNVPAPKRDREEMASPVSDDGKRIHAGRCWKTYACGFLRKDRESILRSQSSAWHERKGAHGRRG